MLLCADAKNLDFSNPVFAGNRHLQAALGSETPIFETAVYRGSSWWDFRPNRTVLDPLPGRFLNFARPTCGSAVVAWQRASMGP